MREKLAAAVPHADWCHEADRSPDFPCACDGYRCEIADALLPVVREIAADELRAAADDLTNLCGPRPWDRLRARADALHPGPPS